MDRNRGGNNEMVFYPSGYHQSVSYRVVAAASGWLGKTGPEPPLPVNGQYSNLQA